MGRRLVEPEAMHASSVDDASIAGGRKVQNVFLVDKFDVQLAKVQQPYRATMDTLVVLTWHVPSTITQDFMEYVVSSTHIVVENVIAHIKSLTIQAWGADTNEICSKYSKIGLCWIPW